MERTLRVYSYGPDKWAGLRLGSSHLTLISLLKFRCVPMKSRAGLLSVISAHPVYHESIFPIVILLHLIFNDFQLPYINFHNI